MKETEQYPPKISNPLWVPIAKRISARFAGQWLADSTRVMLKRGFPLVYYFPVGDVKMKLLQKGQQEKEAQQWGTAIRWHLSDQGHKIENGAWSFEQPSDDAPQGLAEYIAFEWDAPDQWMEEDEQVYVHPRDPYHRIDICHSSRHVKILVGEKVIAETRSAILLFETGLPVRFYIRPTDLNMKLLKATDHKTSCPYKGNASYFSVVAGDQILENIAWTYPFPNLEAQKVKGFIAFFTERLEKALVDGEPLTQHD